MQPKKHLHKYSHNVGRSVLTSILKYATISARKTGSREDTPEKREKYRTQICRYKNEEEEECIHWMK